MGTGGTPSLGSPKTCFDKVAIGATLFEYLTGVLPTRLQTIALFSELLYVHRKFYGQAERAISNSQLSMLPHLHICPIDVVVYHGPY